jgi:broad specificity phosphatase PhoE
MQTTEQTLYVVRHGENPANLNSEFSYKLIDYSLTPKGVRQAEETAAYFRDKDIHEVYSSPLKRALETAEIIAAPHGLPVGIVEGFRENNVGDLEKGPPTDENWALHDRIIADWFAGRHDSAFPGGEDFHTLIRRVREGVVEVLGAGADARGDRRIVIVAHGGVKNAFVRGLVTDIDHNALSRHIANCAVSEFGARLVDGALKLTLRDWAACGHLT